MRASYDPEKFVLLVERGGEFVFEHFRYTGRGTVLRVGQSRAQLKNWLRSYKFHKSHAEYGRKETRNGNCNS